MNPPATQGPAFSRTALTLVVGAIAASLVGMVLLSVFLDDITGRPSASSDGYSVSAIGHHGLVDVLEELDIPVVVSRHASGAKAQDGLLIVAEPVVPEDDAEAAEKLRALVTSAPSVLVVLPKWSGPPSSDNRRWIGGLSPVDNAEVISVLRALGEEGDPVFVEPGKIDADQFDLGVPNFELHDRFRVAQLVNTEEAAAFGFGAHALVWAVDVEDTQVFILSDPDVLNNAGLARPGNARFAVQLVDTLRRGGPVVFDETLHGYAEEPSLWKALFRFPLALVTMHVVLLMIVVVWAGLGRFGPARGAPPALAAGKEYLVRNTAALLRVAGHHGHALERYFAAAIEAVKHDLHAPRELSSVDVPAWLERVRAARGGTIPYGTLRDEVAEAVRTRNARAVLAAADRVHRWRLEMTHGPRHHP